MKIGFLLNLTLLLCLLITQVLIWLVDGTLMDVFAQLLQIRPFVIEQEQGSLSKLGSQTVTSIFHNQEWGLQQRF